MKRVRGRVVQMLLVVGILGWTIETVKADPLRFGSFTFNFPSGTPVAPVGTTIMFSARMCKDISKKTGCSDFISPTVDISGLNQDQVASNVFNALKGQFGSNPSKSEGVVMNGSNSMNLFDDFSVNDLGKIVAIDGMGNTTGFTVTLDGTVNVSNVTKDPNGKWKMSFLPGSNATTDGNLAVDIPSVGTLTTALTAGTTPTFAASSLFNLLSTDGFPDVVLSGNEVSFFLSPADTPIGTISAFSFTGGGLDYSLELPAETPEPATISLLGIGLLGVALCKRSRRMR